MLFMAARKRGLGSPNMDEDTKYEIQSKGGQQSPQNFANNPSLARSAGRKGRRAKGQNKTSVEILNDW